MEIGEIVQISDNSQLKFAGKCSLTAFGQRNRVALLPKAPDSLQLATKCVPHAHHMRTKWLPFATSLFSFG